MTVRDSLLDLVTGGTCVGCSRAGRRLCPWCASDLRARPVQVPPRPAPAGQLPVHAAGDYAGTLRAVVLAHKERSALGLARPLGRVVADVVAGASDGRPVVLVPVPSHPSVVRARGHDPMLRIARRAARLLRARGTPTAVRRLLRVQGRPADQAGLSAPEREANVAGRFRARPAGGDSGHGAEGALLVVDDVVTTGATLREAQRALVAAGWHPDGAVAIAATPYRLLARAASVCTWSPPGSVVAPEAPGATPG